MSYGFLVRLAMFAGLATPGVTIAQATGDSLARRTLDLELGGPGGFASVNYQHRVARQTFARLGFARWSVSEIIFGSGHHRQTSAIVGATRMYDLTWLPGQDDLWGETSIATSVGRRSYDLDDLRESGAFVTLNADIGFRFQGRGGGFVSRYALGTTYVVRSNVHHPRPGFARNFAVSLGYGF